MHLRFVQTVVKVISLEKRTGQTERKEMTCAKKDMTQTLERFVDWWVRYYNKEIPYKVTWSWKDEAYDGIGVCYRGKKEVRFKRSRCNFLFEKNKKDTIRQLIAHEMAHFLNKDHSHMKGKFGELKKRWGFT